MIMKYSIIIPVYNVEKYLEKCLNSILNQTYSNYEIIVVNDGSTDNSQKIIDKMVLKFPEKIKVIQKENSGQSDARNYGVKKATGDYIFFMDSDDFIDENLLEFVNNKLNESKDLDLLRFSKQFITEEGNIISKDKINEFDELNGNEAFIRIRKNRITLETVRTYMIKAEYWKKNNFEFKSGTIYEDLGLVPLVIMKANKVSAVNSPCYNYVERPNSTITKKNYEKNIRIAYNVLQHYDFLMEQIEKVDITNRKAKKMYIQYITDGVFSRLKYLKEEDYKKYKKELKNRKVLRRIKIYSFKSLLKKAYYTYILL